MKRCHVVVYLCLSTALHAWATTYYVDASRPDDTGSGLSWATAKKTIQAGVNLSISGDSVLVKGGTYDSEATVTPGYSVSNRVYIAKAIALEAVDGPEQTFIVGAPATGGGFGSNAVRGMFVAAVNARISGFTFTNGFTVGTLDNFHNSGGGGLCAENGSPLVVSNCAFIGNTAYTGGGISGGSGTVRDSTFINNHAVSDGGASLGGGHIYDSVFTGNTAGKYGGACAESSTTRCTFINNRASHSGGGMINGEANYCTFTGNQATWYGGGKYYASANYCSFVSNSAQYGGGAFELLANHCTFTNNTASIVGGGMNEGQATHCIFYSNTANQYGGGMGAYPFSDSSAGWADHCTFTHNSANNSGGGMYQGTAKNCSFTQNRSNSGGGMRNTKANNCLIAGNSARNGGGMYGSTLNNCTLSGNSAEYDGGGAYQGTANNSIIWYNSALHDGDNLCNGTVLNYSCAPDALHGSNGCITNAPLLISNSHLSTGSPCVGAGSATYVTATDLDGDAWLSPPAMGCDQPDDMFNGVISLALNELPVRTLTGREIVATVFIQGKVSSFKLDFGNGNVVWNNLVPVSNVWNSGGVYTVRLTAYNDVYPAGISVSRTITVATPEEATIHVAPDGNDAHSGESWATAKAAIQAGVDAQLYPGGTVLLTNGTYLLSSEVNIDKEVSVESLSGPDVTIVDGGGITRCFNLNKALCTLSGLTISNGYVENGYGGGIYCTDMGPVVTNCMITENIVIYNYGAGMYYGEARHCVFSGNRAMPNPDYDSGGYGGGMAYGRADNCLFTGNEAFEYGGGAYYCTLVNCTVADNTSSYYGGGAYDCTLTNCIVWYNTAAENGDLESCYPTYTCSPDATHEDAGCITNAPAFANRPGGNYQLTPDSPCIDTGQNNAVSSATDLAAHPRIQYGTVDMGAYEWTAPPYWLAKSTALIPAPIAVGNVGHEKVFELWNKGAANMSYAISDNIPWLAVSPTSGNSSGERDALTVSFDTAGLAIGSYTGTITIASAEAPNAPQTVEVVVDVYTPELDHFEWSPIGTSQTVGSPTSLSLFARDANGYTVPSFSDTVQLTGLIPGVVAAELSIGAGADGSWYPMPARNEVARSQFIYLSDEMGEARRISSLALNVIEIPGRTMNHWTIRMRHTDLDDFSVFENWESDWTTMYQSILTVTSTGWVAFAFDTPFEYNGTDHLMVDFSFRNTSTLGAQGVCEATEATSPRGLMYRGYDDYGDPLDWSGSSNPSPGTDTYIPNLKLDTFIAAPVAMTPTNSGSFTEGIWSGSVTVQEVASNMFLLADDGNGHTGKSGLFDSLADSDLDGIPDYWETLYFGGPTNANPNALAANGINLVRECYIADLDPTDNGDRFLIDGFSAGTVLFDSSGSRQYSLLWRTNLLGGSWVPVVGPRAGAGGPDSMSGTTNTPQGYYRLEVGLP